MHWVKESIPAWLSGIEATCTSRKASVRFAQVNNIDGHVSFAASRCSLSMSCARGRIHQGCRAAGMCFHQEARKETCNI